MKKVAGRYFFLTNTNPRARQNMEPEKAATCKSKTPMVKLENNPVIQLKQYSPTNRFIPIFQLGTSFLVCKNFFKNMAIVMPEKNGTMIVL